MEASAASLAGQLKAKGIRPSYQRVKVLEYLNRTGGHPTAEEIFTALSPAIPSLSKVTVYNALHALVKAGLAREVEIDEAQMRYDVTVDDHGHFLCAACGAITNFPIRIDPASILSLGGFEITHRNVYLKGLCPNCLTHSQTSKE